MTRFKDDFSRLVRPMMDQLGLKDHGWGHIERVQAYGERIILEEKVPEPHHANIYAALTTHDIGRSEDGWDKEHGMRSAEMFARIIHPQFPFLDLESITFALAHHQNSRAELGGSPVVGNYQTRPEVKIIVSQVMWDADRLDLPRIPKYRGAINPNYLNTRFAKEFANSPEHLAMYDGSFENIKKVG